MMEQRYLSRWSHRSDTQNLRSDFVFLRQVTLGQIPIGSLVVPGWYNKNAWDLYYTASSIYDLKLDHLGHQCQIICHFWTVY